MRGDPKLPSAAGATASLSLNSSAYRAGRWTVMSVENFVWWEATKALLDQLFGPVDELHTQPSSKKPSLGAR